MIASIETLIRFMGRLIAAITPLLLVLLAPPAEAQTFKTTMAAAKPPAGFAAAAATTEFPSVIVPRLAGQMPAQAQRTLFSSGLSAGGAESRPSVAATGSVIATEPREGSRTPRGSKILLILAAPMVITAPVTATGSYSGGSPPWVVIPRVAGDIPLVASRVLAARRLQAIGAAGEVADATPGTVLRTDPPEGSSVTAESSVALILALARPTSPPAKSGGTDTGGGSAPPPVPVPRLAGYTPQLAAMILRQSGLSVGKPGSEMSDSSPGAVVRTLPPEETMVPRETPVALILAFARPATPVPAAGSDNGGKGTSPIRVVVPHLAGDTPALAARVLVERRLRVGGARGAVSDAPVGTVIGSDPSEGTVVDAYWPVTLIEAILPEPRPTPTPPVVKPQPAKRRGARPPPPPPVPNVLGWPRTAASNALEAAGFTVDVRPSSFGAWRVDRVKDQWPWGVTAPKGTRVTLVMEQSYGPALTGGGVLLLGIGALAWAASWPFRIVIRPGAGDLEVPTARTLGPLAGQDVSMGWTVEVASREIPPEPPRADPEADR